MRSSQGELDHWNLRVNSSANTIALFNRGTAQMPEYKLKFGDTKEESLPKS